MPREDEQSEVVLDPTRNVLDLVDAAIKRQDDLREAEARHFREIDKLRAIYDDKLRAAETARIDAIRAVDVNAAQQASQLAESRATTLAATVAAAAEAMRTQVGAAAAAAATSLASALVPLQDAIADLRRAQYEQVGQKTQVVEAQAKGANIGLWVGVGLALLTLVLAAVTIVVSVYFATHH